MGVAGSAEGGDLKLKLVENFRSDKYGCAWTNLGPFIPQDKSRDDNGSRIWCWGTWCCHLYCAGKWIGVFLVLVNIHHIWDVLVHPHHQPHTGPGVQNPTHCQDSPWVLGNLVVYVSHCLHLQVHILELHLDFLLGSFGCFFDRFVFQVQELPVDHSGAGASHISRCRSRWKILALEHVWYCVDDLEAIIRHFSFNCSYTNIYVKYTFQYQK